MAVDTQPTATSTENGKAAKNPQEALIAKVTAYVEEYMNNFDGSHDYNHIRRVVRLSHLIYKEMSSQELKETRSADSKTLDSHVITLAALLHDVGDRKYLLPGQDEKTLVHSLLLDFGAHEALATRVQHIVLGVSYSSEIKDPAAVVSLIEEYPELAVVQDADRLDAIGAVGIGRVFTYGGARTKRSMRESILHFHDKLERLEAMMKTEPGRRLARERTQRLKTFRQWWDEEQHEAEDPYR